MRGWQPDRSVVHRGPDLLDRIEERRRIRESLAGGAPGRPAHEGVDLGRDPLPERGRCWHVLVDMLVGDLHRGARRVRDLAGHQLEEHDPRAVDVRAGVRAIVLDLLRRQVGHRAEQQALAAALLGPLDGPGQTEVGDLHPAVVGDQDVLRLDVAVHVAGAVGRGQRRQHRFQDRQGLCGGQRPVRAQHVADGVTRARTPSRGRSALRRCPGRRCPRRAGCSGGRPLEPRARSGRRSPGRWRTRDASP